MADLSGVTDKYFATASESFTDNLASSISAGATTVPVNNASEYTTGEVVVLTVDPGTADEATFIGEKDTGNQFINCVWTEGNTGVGHSAGAVVIDYTAATHQAALVKGIKQFANQDGTLITQAVRDALGLGTSSPDGWEVFGYSISVVSGYNQGNRRYQIKASNVDARTFISKGMWFKATRGTAGATQCADFESSSSQYASRASGSVSGFTATDDITLEAWIKLESYTDAGIICRRDNTGGTGNGFRFAVVSSGRIAVTGYNASNYRDFTTNICPPLGRWVHIAGTLNMSATTSETYINGISVPNTLASVGTPSAFVNTGTLQLGRLDSTTGFLDGKMSDARIWNIVRTQTQIQDNMNHLLTGSESNLNCYWKLNGDFNDSTSNANHLTASGGVVATNTDTPHGNPMGIVVDVTYSAPDSIITIQAGEGYDVPNTTLSNPYYSTQESPYNSINRTLMKLSVWESSVANDVADYIIEEATDTIRWVNSGNALGTFFYKQINRVKHFWGLTAAITTTTGGYTDANVTLPSGFFTSLTVQMIAQEHTAVAQQYSYSPNAPTTSNIQTRVLNHGGAGGTAKVAVYAIGQ